MTNDIRHPVEPPPNTFLVAKLFGHPEALLYAEKFITQHYCGYDPVFTLEDSDDGSQTLCVTMKWNSDGETFMIQQELELIVHGVQHNKRMEGHYDT